MKTTDDCLIVCPHGRSCSVRFTAEFGAGGVAVSIEEIGCNSCSDKIASWTSGAAAEYRGLLVRNYITPAIGRLAVDDEDDETCRRCRHCLGPIVLHCANPRSEFHGGPVAPDGNCPRFEADT